MNCTEFLDNIAAYLTEELSEAQKQAFESHRQQCRTCAAQYEADCHLHQQLLNNQKALGRGQLVNDVMNRIVREQSVNLRKSQTPKPLLHKWRTIMKNRITKYAAAAVVLLAAVLLISFMDTTVKTAYALEDTIKANHSVRYLHIKIYKGDNNLHAEGWLVYGEQGELLKLRSKMPVTEDGPKDIVWDNGKATVFMSGKNILVTIGEKKIAEQLEKMAKDLDPKLTLERLKEAHARGELTLDIAESEEKGKPIILTVYYPCKSDKPDIKEIYMLDAETKLLTQFEKYPLQNGENKLALRIECTEYNQPIDPGMFTFSDLPEDVMRIDQTTQVIGLEQGNMTEKEICKEVVKQFLEALIARDYAKAGSLYEGIPAQAAQNYWGQMNVARIISIGEPEPHPVPGVGGYRVPCKVEIEKDGVKSVYEPYGPGVRFVPNQPGRWGIHGGF